MLKNFAEISCGRFHVEDAHGSTALMYSKTEAMITTYCYEQGAEIFISNREPIPKLPLATQNLDRRQ